jgi:hypothetical protein
MNDARTVDSLYERLIMLDEIAGELDDETNTKIDERRREIKRQILELETR